METASQFDTLRRIETMATVNEYEYGHHLVRVLQTRKELAKRLLHSDTTQDPKETESAIRYCNGLICQILGLPLREDEKI